MHLQISPLIHKHSTPTDIKLLTPTPMLRIPGLHITKAIISDSLLSGWRMHHT